MVNVRTKKATKCRNGYEHLYVIGDSHDSYIYNLSYSYLGGKMILHDFTVRICRQTANTKRTVDAFSYKAEEPDFKELTTDELNKLYLEAQSIMARIQTMLEMKG